MKKFIPVFLEGNLFFNFCLESDSQPRGPEPLVVFFEVVTLPKKHPL